MLELVDINMYKMGKIIKAQLQKSFKQAYKN